MAAEKSVPPTGRERNHPRVMLIEFLRIRPNLIRVVAVVLFFLMWELLAQDVNPLFLVPPSVIYEEAVGLVLSGQLLSVVLQSMEHFIIGLAISIFGGILIGVMIGQWWFFEYTLDPFINALYAMPRVAFVPLIIMWFGLEVTAKVVILISIAIFPVIINTYAGIKDTRGSMLEIGRAFGASEWQIFFKITLPGMVPYVMAGVRLCVGLAIIGMIVGEFFTAMIGVGGMIRDSGDMFLTAQVYIAIILVGIMGVALTELTSWVERRLSHWRRLERQRAG